MEKTYLTPEEKERERNRLYQLYWQRDKEFESAKGKRMILTILGFTIAYFMIIYAVGKPTGFGIIAVLIVAMIIAGFHVFINLFVFMYLFQKGHEEEDRLKAIKKQIDDLE